MPGTDQNTKLLIYLKGLYVVTNPDVTTLTQRYLQTTAVNNQMTARMKALQAAAA
jgi:hypothetical protein